MFDACRGQGAALRLLRTLVVAAGATPGLARAAYEWNFQPPVTPIAEQIIGLHEFIFWICVAIFIGVFLNIALYLRQASRLHVREMVQGGHDGPFQERELTDRSGGTQVMFLQAVHDSNSDDFVSHPNAIAQRRGGPESR